MRRPIRRARAVPVSNNGGTDQLRFSRLDGRVQSRWKAERSQPDWNKLARSGCVKVGSSICSETYSPALSQVRLQPAPTSGPF